MFTGIVEEVGTVRSIESFPNSRRMRIACDKVLEGVTIGDSISVNGVCLTGININDSHWTVFIAYIHETLKLNFPENPFSLLRRPC